MNKFDDSVDMPSDPREVTRLSCMRSGLVPRLKVKTICWHDCGIGWRRVVVERRCPGDVYWARRLDGEFRGLGVVVMAGTFGGVVEDA